MDDIIPKTLLAFFLAIMLSWVPLLMYELVTSVFTLLPAISWKQSTFFTWIALTLSFWWLD